MGNNSHHSLFVLCTAHLIHLTKAYYSAPLLTWGGGGANVQETEIAHLPVLMCKAYGMQVATGHHASWSAQLHLYLTGEAGPVALSYLRNEGFSSKCCGAHASALQIILETIFWYAEIWLSLGCF